jgi:hypothetical protein
MHHTLNREYARVGDVGEKSGSFLDEIGQHGGEVCRQYMGF